MTVHKNDGNGCLKIFIVAVLITLLLGICTRTQAQSVYGRHSDAVYLSFQPIDLGVGVRYDYHISDVGMYSSMSYGDWRLYRANGLRHHVKMSTGVLLPFRYDHTAHIDFTAGINYHYLNSVRIEGIDINPHMFNPWSFELGFAVKFKKVSIAAATDILRWEPCVYIGRTLKYRR